MLFWFFLCLSSGVRGNFSRYGVTLSKKISTPQANFSKNRAKEAFFRHFLESFWPKNLRFYGALPSSKLFIFALKAPSENFGGWSAKNGYRKVIPFRDIWQPELRGRGRSPPSPQHATLSFPPYRVLQFYCVTSSFAALSILIKCSIIAI